MSSEPIRVEEVDALPRTREGTRLGLTVAHDRRDDQVGVVEGRAEGVRQDVAQLSSLVDRAGRRHADMAGDPARRRELPE